MDMAAAIEQNETRVQEMLQKLEKDPVTSRIMEAAETVEEMYEAARKYISVKLDEFKAMFDDVLGYYDKKTRLSDEDMDFIVGGSWKSFWNKFKKVALAAVIVVGTVAACVATAGLAGAAIGAAGAAAGAAIAGTAVASAAATGAVTGAVTGGIGGALLSGTTIVKTQL